MISQMRLLDVRRLRYRKGIVTEEDFEKVRQCFFGFVLKHNSPLAGRERTKAICTYNYIAHRYFVHFLIRQHFNEDFYEAG